MAHRSKNLLEAFQASGGVQPQPPARPAPPPAAPAPKAAPAPRPPGTPAPETPPTPAPPPNLTAPAAHPAVAPLSRGAPLLERLQAWRPTQAQRLIGLGVLIALAFFFLGRASVGRVEAGVTEPDGASQVPAPGTENAAGLAPGGAQAPPQSPPKPAPTAEAAFSAVERALEDPRNKYTVKVVEYTVGSESLAGTTLKYLQDLGLPAAAVVHKGRLSILLGAEASTADLEGLLKRARTINGPGPRSKEREFFDAYIESIDNVYPRGR
jgi:hypothetical protein